MMDLKNILEQVISGRMTLDEVSEWVKASAPLYKRPPLAERLKQNFREELDDLIDRYSDWEIRAREMYRIFQNYTERAFGLVQQDPQLALRIVKTVHLLTRLHENPDDEAFAAFQVGQILYRSKQFFDAVDVLSDVLVRLRQSSQDHLLEVTVLDYLTDSLRADKQLDQALARSEELLEKAAEYNFRGYKAKGWLYKGDVLASKGQDRESLEALRKAVQLRRFLTEEEVKEHAVLSLEAFLDLLGRMANRFGHFDEAIEAFSEVAELEERAGHLALKARAISNIGHTYSQAGETERAIQYLRDAADLAEQAGDPNEAKFWRAQAAINKELVVDGDVPSIQYGEKITNSDTAYLLHAQAQQLALNHQYDTAELMAYSILEWAQREHDIHMEISVHNTLALCYQNTDREKEAIEQLQKGIQLADWSNEHQASMLMRYNLAKLFLKQQKYERSINVLNAGIVFSQQLLSQIATSEFRQQVIAGSLSLYELYALILSYNEDQGNHLHLLSMTESVRARNLYSWLVADHYLETSNLAANLVNEGRQRIQELRALEIELEVRHFTRQIKFQEVTSLQKRRDESREKLDSLFQQAGLPAFDWNTGIAEDPIGDIETLIDEVLEEQAAIVCLFSVPEGICPVILSRKKDGSLKTRGEFLSWDHDDRQEALARWTGNLDFRQGRGTLTVTERHLKYLGPQTSDRFNDLMTSFRLHIADYLVETLKSIKAERLVIIPHRDLALIPYWDLMNRCESVRSITVAPSLNVLRLCFERKRDTRGPSVLLDDKTHTLPQAKKEVEYVGLLRADNSVVMPNSFSELKDCLKSCSLLHIAAHGRFNQDNPYLSGFLASEHEHAKDIFVQYASVPSLELSSEPSAGSIRVMTVAECMARVSLSACRLAILSTCESGIARLHGGGEMTGLPASLLVAGAKSVIASLWPVSDAATAYLMACFYDIWEGGSGKEKSPSTALAEARRKLKTAKAEDIRDRLGNVNLPQDPHPFSAPVYTDAFQCFGSW